MMNRFRKFEAEDYFYQGQAPDFSNGDCALIMQIKNPAVTDEIRRLLGQQNLSGFCIIAAGDGVVLGWFVGDSYLYRSWDGEEFAQKVVEILNDCTDEQLSNCIASAIQSKQP